MTKPKPKTASTAVAIRQESAIYVAPSGELHVPIDGETVWLTQAQMAQLFGSSQRMMSHHINNVFSDRELERQNNIQKMYIDRSKKPITLHSLDVIISVGYRVKSVEGVHFRKWATRILRERLIQASHRRQLGRARMEALGTLASHVLSEEEADVLLSIIVRFSKSWQMLRQYDENQLPDRPVAPTTKRMKRLTIRQAQAAIALLKEKLTAMGEATDIFGVERGGEFGGILGNIEQTFDGTPLYPSVEERAAALLYFVIKDHPFVDGNKRIGSLLFVHYLEKNGCMTRPDGSIRFNDNALVGIALIVAKSDPKQRDLLKGLILAMLA